MATKYEEQLRSIFNNVNEWLKYAEAKNFGLLTLIVAIAFGFTQINFSKESELKTVGCYIFLPIAFFSFFSSLLSLFPILSKFEKGYLVKSLIDKLSNLIDEEKSFENIHYFGYLRTLDEANFETKFLTKINSTDIFTQYEKELTKQILYNSRITWLKYQLFKIGAFIFLFALILSIIALPILKFF